MRAFVKSLNRLYVAKKVDLDKIKSLLAEQKITAAEYDYIVGISETK